MSINHRRISKHLSLVLRHKPESIGIRLDEAGWVSVDELLACLTSAHRPLTIEQLYAVVRENDKQRFQLSDDQTRIRATQGHSVAVDLGYEESEPPGILYHGTPEQFVASVLREGLKKRKRHHVHLHGDLHVATAVGQRRGQPVVLEIQAQRMATAGFAFFMTPNKVWLTDHVPAEFIRRIDK